MSQKFIASGDFNSSQVLEVAQDFLEDNVNYDVSFSDTKTSHSMLKEQFQQFVENGPYRSSLLNLYLSTQQFISRLERSKLYRDVDVYFLPGDTKDHVHLHFQIRDRSPFFMSVQNSFDRDGAATLQMKGGLKNFSGVQDTLAFELERQLSGQGQLNWSLQWGAQRTRGDSLNVALSQVERQIHSTLLEQRKALTLRYTKNNTVVQLERSFRANRIQLEGVGIRNIVKNQYHLQHLDFLPSAVTSIGVEHTLKNTMEESERENIFEGQCIKLKAELGFPWYLKTQFLHLYETPLYRYKRWLRNLRNCSFQSNLSVGFATSGHLHFNDTFNNVQVRGYSYVQNEESFTDFRSARERQVNLFGKWDLKLNFHNICPQSAKMFYFLSGYLQGEKDKQWSTGYFGRMAGGVGLSLPVAEFASIEVLLNMMHLNRRRFDSGQRFQLRVSIED